MASFHKVNPPIPPLRTVPPWDTPGDVVLTLELDANEAEAVRRALFAKDYTRRHANVANEQTALPSTSLLAAGTRVYEALVEADV